MLKRLFIAADLPEEARQELAHIQLPNPKLRRVPPSQLHLTLAFLGDVEPQQQRSLEEHLGQIRTRKFRLALANTGTFTSRRGSVVWAGIPDPPPELIELHALVNAAAEALGIPADSRDFHPHVTLARAKTNVRAESTERFWSGWITGFSLVSSTLHPSGPIYHTESTWPLEYQ